MGGLVHEMAGWGTLGVPGTSAGSLVGRIGIEEILGLMPTH